MRRIFHEKPARQRGYTMLEMMVSLSAAAILVSGWTGTIFIATRATDRDISPAAASLDGTAALEQLFGDLSYATTFHQQATTSLAFSVPDRDGDGIHETTSYAWAATGSRPLRRTYKGATSDLLSSVHGLSFAYRNISLSSDGSTDLRWLRQDSSNSGTLTDFNLDGPRTGTYFRPILPSVAAAWTVSRLKIFVQQQGGRRRPNTVSTLVGNVGRAAGPIDQRSDIARKRVEHVLYLGGSQLAIDRQHRRFTGRLHHDFQ